MAHLSYSVGGDSNLVSFKSAARVPIDSLKVHFKPIQEGAGDPSPENVRPITGWTGVEAYKTGKNLFDQSRQPVINGAYYAWYDIAPEGWVTLSVKDKGNGADISGISFGVKSKRGTGVLWVLLNGQYIEPRVVIDAECLLLNPATNDALNKLLARYDIQLELGQTATSYEPYTGQTIPVEFHGKNLCPAATGTEIYNTWERPSGSSSYEYTINGLDPEQDYTLQVTITEPVVADGGHRLYFNGATTSFIDTRATDVPITKTLTKKPREDGSITITHNAYALYTNAEYAAALTNIQLELGSTATAYEPYNNTFYGGYVDIAKGELVVDREKRTIQSFSGAWGATNNGYAVFTSLSKRNWDIAQCNQFTKSSSSYSSMPLYSFLGGSGVDLTWTFILPSTVTSKAEADAWLANLSTPLEVVCPLDTPITYQLTPTELKTLLSTNNIWSNANDVTEVSYAVHDSAMIRAAKRRMAMAANSRDSLPAPYRRVEYIGAEGANPYIDTGMHVTAELECDIRYYNDKQEAFLFGARNGVSSGNYCNFNIDGSVDQSRFDYASIKGGGDLNLTGVHDGEYTLSFHNRQFSITNVSTGVTLNRDYSSATFSSLNWRNLYLFAVNTNGTVNLGSTEGALRIYSGKIWIGGKLAGDYIPCVRKADDKPGMYDTVTRTFLTSANSDEFVPPLSN